MLKGLAWVFAEVFLFGFLKNKDHIMQYKQIE